MEWLTKQQVKDYATTPKKALEISIKHWWQNRTATRKELDYHLKLHRPCSGAYCGLCKYYPNCKICILKIPCDRRTSLFVKARSACWLYEVGRTKKNFQVWQAAAKEMHLYLCSLRRKSNGR